MTAKEFLKLTKRDFENGSVRDEIYSDLKERDFLKQRNKDLEEQYQILLQKVMNIHAECHPD